MKLIVQVPCHNEAETLGLVLATIPKSIKGIDIIETLIIDDGCTDGTADIARSLGVNHIVTHKRNRGLARSFRDGANRALELGADIVVNTDGDNQYPSAKIGDLVKPIIDGTADIVIADRQTQTIAHFSPFKKFLQRFGTGIVNSVADTNVPDAASGFRAYSKESLLELNTISSFSYAMESIIQAGNRRLAIASIPITTNPKTRESRLFKSMGEHVVRSGVAIMRAYFMYKPYILFNSIGLLLLLVGLSPFVRYGLLVLADDKGNHLQSLIIGAVLLISALLFFVLGVMADLIRINRILHEEALEQIKRERFKS